jgi:hypothetical protein
MRTVTCSRKRWYRVTLTTPILSCVRMCVVVETLNGYSAGRGVEQATKASATSVADGIVWLGVGTPRNSGSGSSEALSNKAGTKAATHRTRRIPWEGRRTCNKMALDKDNDYREQDETISNMRRDLDSRN